MVDKLKELLELSKEANTDFEKATVFATCEAIFSYFERYNNKDIVSDYAYQREKLTSAINCISAIVGYNDSNDKSADIAFALREIQTLKGLVED